MKVLIGYDGSECAKAAIEDLVLAGLPADVDARVLSVADLLVPVPYEGYQLRAENEDRPAAKLVRTARALAAEAMHESQQASAEGVAMVAALFPGWAVRAEAVADSPYWALVKKAEETRADLVIVGSHGRAALGRLFLGSVSQNVLGYAPCSVRIARTFERPTAAPPRLVLGVDGSPDAERAVEEIARRRWPEGTEVRVVTAANPQLAMAIAYHSACGCDPNDEVDVVSAARHCAESVAHQLSERGLTTTSVVEHADPKQLLIEQARAWPADCIFIGAKGHRRLDRFLLGSVSAAVAARAPCSVEVVRGPAGVMRGH